jgi:hypothetical protein
LRVDHFVQEHHAAAVRRPLAGFFGEQDFGAQHVPGHGHAALRGFQQGDAAVEAEACQQFAEQIEPGGRGFAPD